MGIHPVVQQHAHHAGGNDGRHHLEPELPGLFFLLGILLGREGIQLVEKQHNDRQNGAQLDDHLKHALEFIGNLQCHKFIEQNQMSRGGNRQPLGDALHDAEQYGFQYFKHTILLYVGKIRKHSTSIIPFYGHECKNKICVNISG